MRGKFLNTPPMNPLSVEDTDRTDSNNEKKSTGDESMSPDTLTTSTNSLFDDLDAAESMVVHLLDVAASTAEHLSSLAAIKPLSHHRRASDTDQFESHAQHSPTVHRHTEEKLKKNGKEFLDTLKQIHSLLTPHAHMVQAYEESTAQSYDSNSTQENRNIYVSKLELRLAMEKRNILQDFLQLEQEERADIMNLSNKDSSQNENQSLTDHSVLGKRKNME